jgi:hypothetical protein
MKILHYVILFLLMLVGNACDKQNNALLYSDHNYKKFHKNGAIKVLADTVNGVIEGKLMEFSENGTMTYLGYYHNALRNGIQLKYYLNGFPKYDMYYLRDTAWGIQYNYYEHDSGKVKDKFIFVNNPRFFDKPVLVNIKQYNEEGKLTNQKGRVVTYIEKDTLNIGEEFSVRFVLTKPEFDRYRVNIGNFNRGLVLDDSINFKSYEGNGHEAELVFKASKLGKNHIRGYLDDFEIRTNDSGYSELSTINNWFDIEYIVK